MDLIFNNSEYLILILTSTSENLLIKGVCNPHAAKQPNVKFYNNMK